MSADGNKFLFFSLLFFGFIFFILSMPGASGYLTGTYTNYTALNYTTSAEETDIWDYGAFFVQHPFSDNSLIGWIIIAIFLVDLYIILSSFQILGTGGA